MVYDTENFYCYVMQLINNSNYERVPEFDWPHEHLLNDLFLLACSRKKKIISKFLKTSY